MQSAFDATWGNVTLQAATLSPGSFAPASLTAQAGNQQVRLLWTAPVGSNTYTVKRSQTSGGPYTAVATGIAATSYADTTVQNGTTYYYVVSATNTNTGSFDSSEVSATPTAALSNPVFQINCGGPATRFFAADQDFSGGLTAGSTVPVDLSQVSNPAPPDAYLSYRYAPCSYTIPGLQPGGPYTVRLHFAETFWNASNLRVFGATINGTSVLSSFDIFAAAGGINRAIVQQFNTTADGSGAVILQFSPTPGSFDQNPMVNAIEVLAGTSVPAVPTGLTAVADRSQVDLSWNAVSGATSYIVKRSTTSGGPYSVLGSNITGTTYTDTSASGETVYYYVVSAVNAVGEGGNSREASVTSGISAPGNLHIASIGDGNLTLAWSAVANARYYQVFRASTSGGPFSNLGFVYIATSFTDNNSGYGLPNGTYYYVVLAGDNGGPSSYSNEASATLSIAAPTGLTAPPGDGLASLTWNAVSNADYYEVLRSATAGGPYSHLTYCYPGTATATSFTDNNSGYSLLNGTYYYVVRAGNNGGQSAYSNEASATLSIGAPTGLTATLEDGFASLTWNAVGNADYYQVFRANSPGGPYSFLGYTYPGTATATSFTDNNSGYGLPDGTYYYVVRAGNNGGQSTNSNEATVVPVPFFLRAQSATVSVSRLPNLPSASTTSTITATARGIANPSIPISLSLGPLPPGIAAWFSSDAATIPPAVAANLYNPVTAGKVSVTLYLQAGAGATAGTYPITVTGTTAGSPSVSTVVTLTVLP